MSGREARAVDPFDLQQQPDLDELLRTLARNIRLSIRTMVPASVVSYDAARQRAVVQVALLQVVRIVDPARVPRNVLTVTGRPPNAEAVLQPLQLVDIPVAFPRTNAGYITFPLVAGDTGELIVADRSLDQWLLKGLPTDPQLAFTHALKDSVFHPGLHPDTNPITPPTDAAATVVEGTQIKIGRAAALAAARATDPLSASANLSTWAAAVEAALVTAMSPIAPASSWATLGLGGSGALGTITSGSAKTSVE